MHLFREVAIGGTHMEHINVHSIWIYYLFKPDIRLELRDRSVFDWTTGLPQSIGKVKIT
jgi:hypothetical protein